MQCRAFTWPWCFTKNTATRHAEQRIFHVELVGKLQLTGPFRRFGGGGHAMNYTPVRQSRLTPPVESAFLFGHWWVAMIVPRCAEQRRQRLLQAPGEGVGLARPLGQFFDLRVFDLHLSP